MEIIFYVFDLNGDEIQSTSEFTRAVHHMREFVKILQRRQMFAIDGPLDPGLVNMFKCWWACARSCNG